MEPIRVGRDDRMRSLSAVLSLLGKKAIKEWLFHVPRLFVGYVFQGMQGRQAPSSHAAYSNGATSGSLTRPQYLSF
jgi:hypothetical protein